MEMLGGAIDPQLVLLLKMMSIKYFGEILNEKKWCLPYISQYKRHVENVYNNPITLTWKTFMLCIGKKLGIINNAYLWIENSPTVFKTEVAHLQKGAKIILM